jgi:hypothetical protein
MARLILALTFALALLAGCGGGHGPGDGGGGGRSKGRQQFVADANKICREGERAVTGKVSDIRGKLQNAGTAQEQQKLIADALETTAKVYQPYLDRLDGLKAPADLSGEWSKFMDGIDRAFRLIPDVADATRGGDQGKLDDLTKDFQRIANDTRPFAIKYRLNDCLPESSAPTG